MRATWILLPVIITLSSVIESHAPLKFIVLSLLYPGTMTTYTRQSFHAERQKEDERKENGKWIFSYSRSGVITRRISLMRLNVSFSRILLRIIVVTREGYCAPPVRCWEKFGSTLSFSDYDDKSVLVNDIGRFFARIRDQIDSTVIAEFDTVSDDPVVSDAKILSEFKPLSEADILALIQKSSKKTCSLDLMRTKLVVESLDHLLPVITKMINLSLLGGHFPKAWKEALIYPRKKAGINDFTNLRPVSNLQYVS